MGTLRGLGFMLIGHHVLPSVVIPTRLFRRLVKGSFPHCTFCHPISGKFGASYGNYALSGHGQILPFASPSRLLPTCSRGSFASEAFSQYADGRSLQIYVSPVGKCP